LATWPEQGAHARKHNAQHPRTKWIAFRSSRTPGSKEAKIIVNKVMILAINVNQERAAVPLDAAEASGAEALNQDNWDRPG
jgi:hypothetical protein